ncbi:MAG: thiol-disulfide oxidoreductase DCC family protein [Schleiferiaceae bacterium]|jgi:predicted DCC family thiol-disulfide oxidoreductase YuxK
MESDIVLFDGPCTLCNKSVQWIYKRDALGQFRFSSLQGNWAQSNVPKELLSEDSVLFYQGGTFFTRSTAALMILSTLPKWRWTKVLIKVPKVVRDVIYNWIAKNRMRWFGTGYCALLPEDRRLY